MPGEALRVTTEPWGLTEANLKEIARTLLHHQLVARELRDSRSRLLQLRPVYNLPLDRGPGRPLPPTQFHATFFDYSKNHALLVAGDFVDGLQNVEVSISEAQPLPTREEFIEAVNVLRTHGDDVGTALREDRYAAFPTIPPLRPVKSRTDPRALRISLIPRDNILRHRVISVALSGPRPEVLPDDALDVLSSIQGTLCGMPGVVDPASSPQTGGAVWVTVSSPAGEELWSFGVVRPAATGDIVPFPPGQGEASATNGAAVELWDVNYRRHLVLARAGVPIINVKYNGNNRGPLRDWGLSEGRFQTVAAPGPQPADSGFVMCSQPPSTAIDSGIDAGNFAGVAIYATDQAVLLTSELEAGEYRYSSSWEFRTDGALRPRFGFAAINDPIICTVHHHHAYWRFDFDIAWGIGLRVEEMNSLVPGGSTPISTEGTRARTAGTSWQVLDPRGYGYELVPGGPPYVPDDVPAAYSPDWYNDASYPGFPAGDVWILNRAPTVLGDAVQQEIDDGGTTAWSGLTAKAKIGAFAAPPQQLNGDHVVLWYGGHCTHDALAEGPGVHGHVVGPTLKVVNWWL